MDNLALNELRCLSLELPAELDPTTGRWRIVLARHSGLGELVAVGATELAARTAALRLAILLWHGNVVQLA